MKMLLLRTRPFENMVFTGNMPKPPRGSDDMTMDWFYRGKDVFRKPLLEGTIKVNFEIVIYCKWL